MSRDDIIALMKKTGAIAEGHFAYPAGFHSTTGIRPEKTLQFPSYNRKLSFQIVQHFLEWDVHVVMAITPDAVHAAIEIGRQLEARTIFMEPGEDGQPVLERGFQLYEGERVVVVKGLVVDDTEIKPAISAIRKTFARHIGTASIVDIRMKDRVSTIRDVSVLQFPLEQYQPEVCPLCTSNVPLVVL